MQSSRSAWSWVCLRVPLRVPLRVLGCASKQLAAQHAKQMAALETHRQQLASIQGSLAAIEDDEQMNLRARRDDAATASADRAPHGDHQWRTGIEQRLDTIGAKLDRSTPGATPTPRPAPVRPIPPR